MLLCWRVLLSLLLLLLLMWLLLLLLLFRCNSGINGVQVLLCCGVLWGWELGFLFGVLFCFVWCCYG